MAKKKKNLKVSQWNLEWWPSKAFHVFWLKGEMGKRRELNQVHCALCLPFLLPIWCTDGQQLFLCVFTAAGEPPAFQIGVILYYLWLSGILFCIFLGGGGFGSRLSTICWLTEISRRGRGRLREIKCKQRTYWEVEAYIMKMWCSLLAELLLNPAHFNPINTD